MQTPTRVQSNRVLLAVGAALLLNSAAVGYGFWSLAALRESIKWSLLVTVPSRSTGNLPDAGGSTSHSLARAAVHVDLFSDFGCSFCRAGAAAVDSVRRLFGKRVSWRYWHFPRYRGSDPLSFRAALLGACVAQDDLWALYVALSDSAVWSERALEAALITVGVDRDSSRQCLRSSDVKSAVWSDLFQASRIGIRATPTIIVNGIRVEGRITSTALIALIEDAFGGREGYEP